MQYNGNAYFGKEGAAGRGEMDRSSMCDDRSASRESGRILPAKGLLLVCLVPVLGLWPGPASAEEKKTPEPGFVEQIETELKQAAVKVEEGFSSVVKQFEESETPKKVGNELKRSAESLGQSLEDAGKKLKQSFKSD